MKNSFIIFFILLSAALAKADQARFLEDDREAIQARVDLLQQAKKEILVEYFSVWNDEQSVGGMTLLIEAAQRGVKVKVILDALSNTVPLSLFATLVEKGRGADGQQNLEVRLYNPISLNLKKLTHRTHAKMIVVDGEIMITGGRNVGDKYFGLNKKRNFHDLDILLSGNVVKDAQANFMSVWTSDIVQTPSLFEYSKERLDPVYCNYQEDMSSCQAMQKYALEMIEKENLRLKTFFQNIITAESDDIVSSHTAHDWLEKSHYFEKITFLSHQPDKLVSKKRAQLSRDLLEAAKAAQKELNIVSPYLIPTPNLLSTLEELIQRGVRVRIITNSLRSTDNLFAQAGYRLLKPQLVRMGVEIYEYEGPDTIHAKTALIDQKHVLVGTYNIDPRSSFLNREIGISIMDQENGPLAQQLEKIIEDYRSVSILVAKDGKNHNQKWQNEGVSKTKLYLLRSLMTVTPFILNQL